MHSKKSLLLSFLLILTLSSCNLDGRSIFSQIGDFEKVDYNSTSPLYKGSTTGIAFGSGNLFVTSSRRLWRKGSDNKWTDLTSSLPSPFDSAIDIVQLKNDSNQAYLALSNKSGDNLGIYTLDLENSSFSHVSGPILGQQPNRFIKQQNQDGDIIKAFLYAQPSGENPDAKYIYGPISPTFNLNNIGPLNDKNEPPNANMRIIGILKDTAPYTYIVTVSFSNSEQSQIWSSDKKKPIDISPNYRIRLAGQFPIRGENLSPVVSSLSGSTFTFADLSSGKLEIDKGKAITGLGEGVEPNFYGYIDRVPVIATNFGYFETNQGNNSLTFPSDKTTDVSSYTASQISSLSIHGIYTTSDRKVYLTTWSKGLWVRDPTTKKWRSV